MNYTSARYGNGRGYEVSSAGDSRFSAMRATLKDGRSIECHYQCDVKGHDPGGTQWILGKGKAAVDPTVTMEDLQNAYLLLWSEWADDHMDLMVELRDAASRADYLLTDRFASSPCNQAWALAQLLNERAMELALHAGY